MKHSYIFGTAVVALLLPYLADAVTVHPHVGGVEVPLGAVLVFLVIFLPLMVWAAWSLTHPLTRGMPGAAAAEESARHWEQLSMYARCRLSGAETIPVAQLSSGISDAAEPEFDAVDAPLS